MKDTSAAGSKRGLRFFAAALVTWGVFAALTIVGGVGGLLSSGHAASAEYEYGKTVTICHRTGSDTNPTVTISVSENALNGHLAHGDTIGPCP